MAAPAFDPDRRDFRRLARRLRARARRGSALLELVLALVVFGVAIMAANTWIEIERGHARARESGRTVTVLADAARHHVQAHYEDLVGGGPQILTRTDLELDGILPAHFGGDRTTNTLVDAMRRDLAVLVLPTAAGVRVLSGQVPDAADGRRPHAAVTQGLEDQRLGMVQMSLCPSGVTPPCLLGPGVADSIAGFAASFAGQVREGAVMALYEFGHDDFCGDFLHRTPSNLCPDANRMGQDVRVTGRIINAASIEDVTRLVMHGALSVGGTLDVGGTLQSEGRMTAGTGASVSGMADVAGVYGGRAQNPACSNPSAPSAVCSENRVIVGRTLDVTGTADVLGRHTGPAIPGDTDAGDVDAGCLHVRGRTEVDGRVRVTTSYGTPAGSCP